MTATDAPGTRPSEKCQVTGNRRSRGGLLKETMLGLSQEGGVGLGKADVGLKPPCGGKR